MFERYTENARRVIFFARYEASQMGSQAIEPEHILLGLLRENLQLLSAFAGDPRALAQAMRQEIEKIIRVSHKISASVDLPLSGGAKRVLAHAAEKSQALGHHHIGTEHLLIGLINEENSLARRVLDKYEVTEQKIIAWASEQPPPESKWPGGFAARAGGGSCSVPSGGRAPLDGLINKLVERGIITREEFNERVAARQSLSALRVALDALLDLLVGKGVITDDDRREITKAE
jgi:hypothetical protein